MLVGHIAIHHAGGSTFPLIPFREDTSMLPVFDWQDFGRAERIRYDACIGKVVYSHHFLDYLSNDLLVESVDPYRLEIIRGDFKIERLTDGEPLMHWPVALLQASCDKLIGRFGHVRIRDTRLVEEILKTPQLARLTAAE